MNTAEVIERLESEGVNLTLTSSGGLDISGDKEAVERMLPFLRNHKAEIVDLLARGSLANQKPTPEKVDWLHPCPICFGHLFTESDRGGYFCCECQTLPEGAKPARIVEGSPAVKSAVKVVMLRKRQVNCQAYEQTGVMASTSPEHCREWQGSYCTGCPLQTIH